jgi:N-acetylmuramic acid 6-phosphate etherase
MKAKRGGTKLHRLATEQGNPAWGNLDQKTALEIARTINAEDAKVAAAVERALPQIARAIDVIAEVLKKGGRLIYVGTGTSGRIAALDAAECPPTFNTKPRSVQFVIAGGARALGRAVEANEDSRALGEREIARKKPGKNDVVVGIAASGRTPFTVAAVTYARRRGAGTIAVTCNRNSPLEKAAALTVLVETGPEVIAGSTRMKAGTAQKMVLNMLTSGAMIRLGYVYENLMVNVHQKNTKLVERAVGIVQQVLRLSPSQARLALRSGKGNVPVTLVMCLAGVSRREAERALGVAKGHVRQAILAARSL